MNGGASATGITGKNLILGKEYDNSDTLKGIDNFQFIWDDIDSTFSIKDNKLFQQNESDGEIMYGEIMFGKILILDTGITIEGFNIEKGIYIIQSINDSNIPDLHTFNIDSINSYLNN